MKIKKVGGEGGRVGQGGYEWRSEVFVKIQKIIVWAGGGGGRAGGCDQGLGWGRGVARFGVGG